MLTDGSDVASIRRELEELREENARLRRDSAAKYADSLSLMPQPQPIRLEQLMSLHAEPDLHLVECFMLSVMASSCLITLPSLMSAHSHSLCIPLSLSLNSLLVSGSGTTELSTVGRLSSESTSLAQSACGSASSSAQHSRAPSGHFEFPSTAICSPTLLLHYSASKQMAARALQALRQ